MPFVEFHQSWYRVCDYGADNQILVLEVLADLSLYGFAEAADNVKVIALVIR